MTDLTQEPVSVQLAADWCKVAVPVLIGEVLTSEGEIVAMLITTARQWCEKYTGLSFGPKALSATVAYDAYRGAKTLPYGPGQVVTAAKDAEGNVIDLAQFSSSSYWAEYLKGFTIQNSYADEYGPYSGIGGVAEALEYTIEYTAGYAPGTLPEPLKHAILKTVAELYQNRENTVIGTIVAELPLGAKQLLDPYRSNVLF